MALGASVGFEDLGLCQRVVLLNEPDEIFARSRPFNSKSVFLIDGRFGWIGGALQTLGSSKALLLACSDDIQKVFLVFEIEFMRKIQLVACFAVLAKLDRLVEYVRVGLPAERIGCCDCVRTLERFETCNGMISFVAIATSQLNRIRAFFRFWVLVLECEGERVPGFGG